MINPTNIAASKLMAELAEVFQSPQAVDHWRRVTILQPTVENKLALARAALRARVPAVAAQTLESVSDEAGQSPLYHSLAAQFALQTGSNGVAEIHLAKLTQLEPTNELHRLNLQILRLASTNSTVASSAREFLVGARSNTSLAPSALRSLIADSIARKDFPSARNFSVELREGPGWTLADRLQHLSVLALASDPELPGALAAAQLSTGTNVVAVHQVASWMLTHAMTEPAFSWLTNQPAAVRKVQPFPLALVDAYVARKDWSGLKDYLEEEKWNDDLDHVRFAYLSKASAELNQKMEATAYWRSAVRAAAGKVSALMGLLAFSETLAREDAKEDLLWEVWQRYPSEHWVLKELDKLYGLARNTRGLNKLYSALAKQDPNNVLAQNNLAATSMLLKVNLTEAYRLAREAYQAHPEVPGIVSTYAYSLHLQNRTKEGLEIFAKLNPEQLEQPAIALYYGVLLAAGGDPTTASRYLALAGESKMFPEEEQLLAAAKAGI
jgi:hypothetical protein